MRAMAIPSYGSLDRLTVIEAPSLDPASHQVRVRVHAAALNPADFKVILGALKFLHARNFPMVLGYDYSGTVEAVGSRVSDLEVGAEVFGFLPYSPWNRRGSFAESLLADVGELARKPAGVSHVTAAAAATPGLTALQMLRDLGRVQDTAKRVLVTGASGGVGCLAVGIARRLGATVTAVGSGRGLELARKLGAEAVIDRKSVEPLTAAQGPFDVVLDAAAAYRWRQWRAKLAPGGTYVTTLPSLAFLADKLTSLLSATRVRFINVKSRAADLTLLGEWLVDGLEVPIDHVVPVRDVARALEQLHTGAVLGRIAVDIAGGF
jgi:NADPH:quinone reductase-like Zn-dependent oxidoreductase